MSNRDISIFNWPNGLHELPRRQISIFNWPNGLHELPRRDILVYVCRYLFFDV